MQPYFLQHSASLLSATRVCIHINELAKYTWVEQICNCFAQSVQEHIRPFSSAYKIVSDSAPVNDAWIHALYLVFMGK
jgi:hypothetical protein